MVLLANMSIETIITVYISQLGVHYERLATLAGIVMACSAFGSMLTAAKLGALADRIGAWNVIIGCLILTGLAMLPQAYVTHWWQLAILRGAMGMAIAGLLPSVAKLVRHLVADNESGKMLGYLQSAQFSGQVIGPILGGQIGIHFGLHWVFFVTGSRFSPVRRLVNGPKQPTIDTVNGARQAVGLCYDKPDRAIFKSTRRAVGSRNSVMDHSK